MKDPDISPTAADAPEPRAGGQISLKAVQQLMAPFNDRYGPTIDVHQAAALGGYEVSTLYKLRSQGLYRKSAARSRPLLFMRDMFVWERMNMAAGRAARRSRGTPRGSTTTTEVELTPPTPAEERGDR